MAPLRIRILLFVSLAYACALALSRTVGAECPTPCKPKRIYDKSFELVLDAVKAGCGGTVTAQMVPPFPVSGIQLDVGDTYEITPYDIVSSAPVFNWSGLWHWNESCGKNGRDKCPQSLQRVATSEATYGTNVKFIAKQTGGDKTVVQLGMEPVIVVVGKPAVLQLGVTVGAFPKPENPSPHSGATQQPEFCATVSASRIRIVDETVRIVRRFQ